MANVCLQHQEIIIYAAEHFHMLAIVGQLSNSSNLQVWADESTDDEVLGMVVRTGKLHKYSQDFRTGNFC